MTNKEEKIFEYQRMIGKTHLIKEDIRQYRDRWRLEHPEGIMGSIKQVFKTKLTESSHDDLKNEYQHVFRKKSRWELMRISAVVAGIEFSYAAETAFVSPTLLKIGVEHSRMTLVWALSPLIGFFLTPLLGSISDRCTLHLGRRRPFIILMSIGVLLGLILVPNGEHFGYMLGDPIPPDVTNNTDISAHRTSAVTTTPSKPSYGNWHPRGIFFTILGTVLLDFNADGCQSPARAYLLDITVPEDHAKGLSTFTIMAGVGGFFGYALGGIDWDNTAFGEMLGGHVRAVFTLITFIFEVFPMQKLDTANVPTPSSTNGQLVLKTESTSCLQTQTPAYGSTAEDKSDQVPHEIINNVLENNIDIENDYLNTVGIEAEENVENNSEPSLMMYLTSIIYMPGSMRILCVTNLFSWMAHVCYSLYFTDFVGESVFHGNPTAPPGSESRILYEEGVRFGCWGMSLYSLSCVCYSLIIDKLISHYKSRRIYVGGLLTYCLGMGLLALSRSKTGVIVFSGAAGVMYSTLFTMPYLLISKYHENGTFEMNSAPTNAKTHIRGIGTDIAIVSSMVFLAQFILSICMGTIVSLTQTTTAVICVASALSFCGAISATQVMYLD
ncbi:Solute carrier family 45 member 1 [Carabus blaptoides fortunei]